MTSINTGSLDMNLQLIQGMSNSSNSLKSGGMQTGAIYAQEGEPMYQKDMDADEDGVITFQEFNDYCDANDIKYPQRQQMLQNRLEYQLHSDRARVSAEIREIKSDANSVYAKEDDENYDEAADYDNDGKVTYDEYMRYCEENEEAKDKPVPEEAVPEKTVDKESGKEKFVVKNDGKAINTYMKNEGDKEQAKVEEEA